MPDFLSGINWTESIKTVVEMIWKDCCAFLEKYTEAGLKAGSAAVLLYLLTAVCRGAFENLSLKSIIRLCRKTSLAALLGFYFCMVLEITVLSREAGTEYILNLLPFGTWETGLRYTTLWVENILLLMPLGILLYLLWEPFRRPGRSILMGFLCSVAIESVQLITRRGKFELDDIMNNVLGMLIGFWLCRGMHGARPSH